MHQASDKANAIQRAVVVLPCVDLEETIDFFIDRLGFRLHEIYPADQPAVAEISGYGLHIRLQKGLECAPGILRLETERDIAKTMKAPNGTQLQFVNKNQQYTLPALKPSFVISRFNQDWHLGRAGMRYRDLIPDRQGGRFIASHIQIENAGSVADYVHYHRVRFQMIYCLKGWVKLVYEDQGQPFLLNAGDCVLQPPMIRHRVLESSAGLEVIEIGSPAEHPTYVDHDLPLPNNHLNQQRTFDGQTFIHHRNAKAIWQLWRIQGFEVRDLGIEKATNGMAGAQVVRTVNREKSVMQQHLNEFLFLYVLAGELRINLETQDLVILQAGDCCVIPSEFRYAMQAGSDDLEFLEVSLPAKFEGSTV